MRRHFPNILTLCNLLCGCMALVAALSAHFDTAALWVLGSFVFDYADGMAARALGVSSPLGKQLDSLADVVSFGVAPGAMLFTLINGAESGMPVRPEAMPAFALSAFAAYRLGKFNLDTRQQGYFLGLSTPAACMFVLGYTLSASHNRLGWGEALRSPWAVYAVVAALSILMLSEIPMFGLKVKAGGGRRNAWLLLPLALAGVLLFALREAALSVLVALYVLVSLAFKKQVAAYAG